MDLSLATRLVDSREEIDIDKHFKVVAGPGAGKTTFLINHINNIIEKSKKISDLRKIACITYTNVGVENIIEKLGDAYDCVEVSTIHSFLYKHIVKPYLWVLNSKFKFDLQKINGHEEFIPTFSILKEWKTQTKQFHIIDNKKLSKSLSKLSWILHNDKIELKFKNAWEGQVGEYSIRNDSYLPYKEICWRKGIISHDDVLYLSYLIIEKNSRVLEIIRGKFPYILMDEFQDTNPIQSAIIKIISNEETIVGVIGDECQSIYSFQGADVGQFIKFDLPNMKTYYIEDNRRSTEEIINLLNYMRREESLKQKSPEDLHGDKPYLIIGNFLKIFKNVKEICENKAIYTLSYRKELSNQLKYGVGSLFSNDITNELIFDDGERGKIIFYSICAIEHCKQNNFKEALKSMKKAYKKTEEFDDRCSFNNVKRLVDDYDKISNLNIIDFYNEYIFGFYGIKGRITSGKKKEYYEKLTYKQVACTININDDTGAFRTIHKAKGDEFENVLLLINPSDFNENTNLEFLFNPDMTKEEHRVYYVALSRAKKRLFIAIPPISERTKDKLGNIKFLKVENL